MNSINKFTATSAPRTLERVCWLAACLVTCGWAVALATIILAYSASGGASASSTFGDGIVIAICSLVIAYVSMLPGVFACRSGDDELPSDSKPGRTWNRFVAALILGMTIRSVGTVALFLTCRYHMASTTEIIAALTIGWYVWLTSIEVCTFARALPKTAKTPSFPETSLG